MIRPGFSLSSILGQNPEDLMKEIIQSIRTKSRFQEFNESLKTISSSVKKELVDIRQNQESY